MFHTASGVTIPFPDRIKEEFQIFENSILLNLSFEKLEPFIKDIIDQLAEPMFFVLEMPLSQQEESELRNDNTSPFHKKICYLDGQSKKQIYDILVNYGDILFNDGISQFAIYSHVAKDGIYVQKYKIVSLFSSAPERYIDFLKSYNIVQTDNLFTVWDTFSYDAPGEVHKVEINGIGIFDVYRELVKMGMYVAKVAVN